MSRMPVKPKRDLVLEASSRAKNLQIDEIHSIKAAWDKFDLNSDGEVKADEVAEFLRHLNINVVSEAQKQKILNELDRYLLFDSL